jgi:hypothetical protein
VGHTSEGDGLEDLPLRKLSFSTFLPIENCTIFVFDVLTFDIFAFDFIRGNRKDKYKTSCRFYKCTTRQWVITDGII